MIDSSRSRLQKESKKKTEMLRVHNYIDRKPKGGDVLYIHVLYINEIEPRANKHFLVSFFFLDLKLVGIGYFYSW